MVKRISLGVSTAILAVLFCAATAASPKISNVVIADKPKSEAPEAIAAPADKTATYTLIRWTQLGNGNRIGLVKRLSEGAESFTRIEVSCANRVFRPLGQGKTIEAASKPAPATGFATLTADTVSGQIGAFLCKKK